MTRLGELACVIRSKNVGPYMVALDVVFDRRDVFARVVESGMVSREKVAALYRIRPDRITDVVVFEPGLAIKVSMVRPIHSGNFTDADVLGSQQYAPPYELEIPD